MTPTTTSSLRAWIDDALCAQTDPEIFFPAKGMATQAAIRICRACPARPQCLAEALDTATSRGLWGGMTSKQRAAERKRRNTQTHEIGFTAA